MALCDILQSLKETYVIFFIILLLFENVSALYNENSEPDTHIANVNVTVCSGIPCYSRIEQARYGSTSSHQHVEGYLIHATELNGCKKFKFPVKKSPWIALISRGNCMFTEKIRNAESHNASGVIVYGDKRGQFAMEHNNPNMVAVSVSFTIGNKIASKLNRSSVYVEITFDRTIEGRKINTISVLFVSISFIVLMVISLAWLVFYYVQRFRFLYARDKTERRLTTAAKKAISKLHSRTISKKDEEDGISSNSCAVCLEEYKSGETLRTLPCNHEFHKHCVDPWLIEHRTCPMCKTNILKELGMLQPEDERLSSQENDVTVSITPNDHGSALHNSGLAEELGLPANSGHVSQATLSQPVCSVTPVETTTSCELSYVRIDKSRSTEGEAV